MMKKLLLASAAFVSTQAMAEPWTVGPQTPTYTTAHPYGAPNTAPAYASAPADIASNFTVSNWLHTSPPGGQYDGPGVGQEAKARFDCNIAFESHDDPIIAPGVQNGASHDHSFFGNIGAAAAPYNVTYTSLRSSGNSTCYGGPINRTLYWEPSVKKVLTNGAVVTVKPKNIVTYYVSGVQANQGDGSVDDPSTRSVWPRDISMIFGFNMSDPTFSRYTSAIAAGNAVNPGRYVAISNPNGFAGWTCAVPNTGAGAGGNYANSPVAGAYQPYLRNADGTATLDCAPNTDLIAQVESEPCWDGVNLHSPDGRGHFLPYIQDNVAGKKVCPDGWYRVTVFLVRVAFNQTGSAEYKEWYLSSDRMDANPANWFKNGETMHADLIPAWDYGTAASPGIFLRFSNHCGGITITEAATGGTATTMTGDRHECGSGRVDSLAQVFANEASPDGSQPNPIVNLSPDQRGMKKYFPGKTGNAIPGTIGHNH
jgi:hypothetical protein